MEQNNQKALYWYTKAAEQGIVEAQLKLGYWYQTDNSEEAFKWFEKAAVLSSDTAKFKIAYWCENRCGTKKDIDRAIRLYTELADKGDLRVTFNLGYIYAFSEDAFSDYTKAYELILKSAKLNDYWIYYYLSHMHYEGLGVPVDKIKAHMWWRLSQRQIKKQINENDEYDIPPDWLQAKVLEKLAELQNKMTKNEIAGSIKLKKAWEGKL